MVGRGQSGEIKTDALHSASFVNRPLWLQHEVVTIANWNGLEDCLGDTHGA